MKSLGVKAGIRKANAAVAQPKGSSYAGKAAAKRPEVSVKAAAEKIRIADNNKTGKIVRDTKDYNPFRVDKELSRKIR